MTFQPFAVKCLTCGSNLRVTDPAIVGTIAACPKCQSMVQIDPVGIDPDAEGQSPPQQLAVGSSSVDSQAITEDAIAPQQLAADSKPGQPFVGGELVSQEQLDPIPPTQRWQSERTERSRQIALIATLSFTGLLIAAAMFGWFVSSWHQPSASIDNSEVDPATETTAEATEPVAALREADSVIDETSPDPNPQMTANVETASPAASIDLPDSLISGSEEPAPKHPPTRFPTA